MIQREINCILISTLGIVWQSTHIKLFLWLWPDEEMISLLIQQTIPFPQRQSTICSRLCTLSHLQLLTFPPLPSLTPSSLLPPSAEILLFMLRGFLSGSHFLTLECHRY